MRRQATSGTGLGLAIVAAIARAHGGVARVTAAGPAGGAMFLLDLPAGGLPDPNSQNGDDGKDDQEAGPTESAQIEGAAMSERSERAGSERP